MVSDDVLSMWKEDTQALFLIEPDHRLNILIRKIGSRFYVTEELSKIDCCKPMLATKWKEELTKNFLTQLSKEMCHSA